MLQEAEPRGVNAYVWNTQEEAERQAKQLVLANHKDMFVFEMIPKAKLKISAVDREDLTLPSKENVTSKLIIDKEKPTVKVKAKPAAKTTETKTKPKAKRQEK